MGSKGDDRWRRRKGWVPGVGGLEVAVLTQRSWVVAVNVLIIYRLCSLPQTFGDSMNLYELLVYLLYYIVMFRPVMC